MKKKEHDDIRLANGLKKKKFGLLSLIQGHSEGSNECLSVSVCQTSVISAT